MNERRHKSIYFESDNHAGSRELAKRFINKPEGIEADDITAIAEQFVEQLRQDTKGIGLDPDKTVYVFTGLLDKSIKQFARIRGNKDPAVHTALEQIRSAVAEKVLQLVNKESDLLSVEQIYIITKLIRKNPHRAADNVWLAQHSRGEQIVKKEVTGLQMNRQKLAYQALRELLTKQPHPNLRPLMHEYDADGPTMIGSHLEMTTLKSWLEQPSDHSLKEVLLVVLDAMHGSESLLKNNLYVNDNFVDNIGIDSKDHSGFLFDFGQVNSMDIEFNIEKVTPVLLMELFYVLAAVIKAYPKSSEQLTVLMNNMSNFSNFSEAVEQLQTIINGLVDKPSQK